MKASKIEPYLSLDLETTGLNLDRSMILEIGAVFDDGVSPIEELKTFRSAIYYENFDYSEPYAMNMNAKLIEEISKMRDTDTYTKSRDHVFHDFTSWLRDVMNAHKIKRIQVAGKNVAGFDIPILRNNIARSNAEDFTNKFSHRTIDVGSLYYDVFGKNESLSEINKLTGRNQVAHTAIEDCLDVVHAIRYKVFGGEHAF